MHLYSVVLSVSNWQCINDQVFITKMQLYTRASLIPSPCGAGDREYHFGHVKLSVVVVGLGDLVAAGGLLLDELHAGADGLEGAFPLEVRIILEAGILVRLNRVLRQQAE